MLLKQGGRKTVQENMLLLSCFWVFLLLFLSFGVVGLFVSFDLVMDFALFLFNFLSEKNSSSITLI